ncbi:MAG: RNA polymerase sigma factor SigZ [Colwellia sp.]
MNVEQVCLAYQNHLKVFLHKNISNPSDVDDLLQEILIKTYQSLDKVTKTEKIKSWLFQIANRTIIDFYRNQGRNSKLVQQINGLETDTQENIFEDLSLCIAPFIQGLPQAEADLLTAIELEGISQKAYAPMHNIKYTTLKSKVQKSRQQLFNLFNHCCNFSLNADGSLANYATKKGNCTNC